MGPGVVAKVSKIMAKGKFVFEKAIGRAEEIAEAIEQGEVGLEDSIKQFEEGISLIQKCRKVLDDAEFRIQTLEASLSESAESKTGKNTS